MGPLEPGNKPELNTFTSLLQTCSVAHVSLFVTLIWDRRQLECDRPHPSFNSLFAWLSEVRDNIPAASCMPGDGDGLKDLSLRTAKLINSWIILILSPLLHSPAPKDRPQFYDTICHQTIRPGATNPNTLCSREFWCNLTLTSKGSWCDILLGKSVGTKLLTLSRAGWDTS